MSEISDIQEQAKNRFKNKQRSKKRIKKHYSKEAYILAAVLQDRQTTSYKNIHPHK